MYKYAPDAWVIVKVHDTHKVLAGFYGGYVHGDSWRLSSGITRIEETETHWLIHNVSGSIYCCHKEQERLTTLTGSILQRIVDAGVGAEKVLFEDIRGMYEQTNP